jgi:hypothetical protein
MGKVWMRWALEAGMTTTSRLEDLGARRDGSVKAMTAALLAWHEKGTKWRRPVNTHWDVVG